MPRPAAAALCVTALSLAALAAADPPDPRDPAEAAAAAFRMGEYEKAATLAGAAAKADPKNAAAHGYAGLANAKLRRNAEAEAAFTKVIELRPDSPQALDSRGDARLKLGKFKDAVADFDRLLELQPAVAPEHWRRGIALYYAGRYADGVKQFELHRTVNPEDVENSAWHYLCNVRATSRDKAREQLIPVTRDPRVPMRQVLDLYAGKAKPDDVIRAAESAGLAGEPLTEARFYARLYVALYYEGEKDAAKVREYLTPAVEKYKISHYMWDVGAAHLKMLGK